MTTPLGYYPIELFIPHFNDLGHHFPIDDAVVLDWLARRRKPKYAVEVGTFVGLTANIIARHCRRLDCYDIWRERPGSDDPINAIYRQHPDVMQICHDNIMEIGTADVHLVNLAPGEQWYDIQLVQADFIFLDGDHDYHAVKRDIEAAQKCITTGGILCGHDYGLFPGVTLAVDELLPEAKKRGTMWWVGA